MLAPFLSLTFVLFCGGGGIVIVGLLACACGCEEMLSATLFAVGLLMLLLDPLPLFPPLPLVGVMPLPVPLPLTAPAPLTTPLFETPLPLPLIATPPLGFLSSFAVGPP